MQWGMRKAKGKQQQQQQQEAAKEEVATEPIAEDVSNEDKKPSRKTST